MILDCFAQNQLVLAHAVNINYKIVDVAQHLELSDVATSNLNSRSVQSILFLTHGVKLEKTIAVSASNMLVLQQEPQPRVSIEEVTSYLTLVQTAKHEDKWPLVEQRLELQQSAECVVAHGTYNTLVLTQSATFTITRNLAASNTLVISSKANGYKPSKYWLSFDAVVEAP